MNIVRNEKLIQRNSRIAQITMIVSLLILAGGMFISFRYPEQFALSLVALLGGFLLSQIGIFFSNRWGRPPRPDEVLDKGLKGLDKKYTLYHYASPVSHLLLGPAGVWILMPYRQKGTISYSKGRWRQKGGNFYLKLFAQESLGRPDLELAGEADKLRNFFTKNLPEDQIPEVQAALVFMHPDTVIDIAEDESPPAETVSVTKIKDLVRKSAKAKSLSEEKVDLVRNAIEGNA